MTETSETIEENQFEMVSNLLNQQDEVILKLDQLNQEIESLIKQLADERKAELGIEDEPISEKAEKKAA